MNKQEKAQKLLKLIIFLTGAIFILVGLFIDKIFMFLHSHNILSNIKTADLTLIKSVVYGMGIMDIIGAFLFPKFIEKNKV
ncbi:MAG: hypothetical protein WCK67_12780 [bacterium]